MIHTEFMPDVRKIRLSPRNAINMVDCHSVGYFMGDIPSILVHVGGDIFELKMGQCIPVTDRVIQLENPYSRSADVQISLNASPQFQPSADTERQNGFVTYYAGQNIDFKPGFERTDGYLRGAAIMPQSGAVLVDFDTSIPTNVVVYHGASAEHLAQKPAGFMDTDLVFAHAKTSELDAVSAIAGYWQNADLLTWLGNIGLNVAEHRKVISKGRTGETVLVEAGSALFITDIGNEAVPNNNRLSVNMRLREMPSVDRVSNV